MGKSDSRLEAEESGFVTVQLSTATGLPGLENTLALWAQV